MHLAAWRKVASLERTVETEDWCEYILWERILIEN
jgi:hypothetical protein